MNQEWEVIEIKRGPVDQNWWEQAILEELARNPTPWGDKPFVPVEQEGVITDALYRLTKKK